MKDWIVGDGEIPPVRVGDELALGLALEVDRPLAIADSERVETIHMTTEAEFDDLGGGSSCAITSPAIIVRDDVGSPLFLVLKVGEIPVLALGVEARSSVAEGTRVIAHGNLVFEPYLWQPGLVLKALGGELPRWSIRRIRVAHHRGTETDPRTSTARERSAVDDVDAVVVPSPRGDSVIMSYLLDIEPRQGKT